MRLRISPWRRPGTARRGIASKQSILHRGQTKNNPAIVKDDMGKSSQAPRSYRALWVPASHNTASTLHESAPRNLILEVHDKYSMSETNITPCPHLFAQHGKVTVLDEVGTLHSSRGGERPAAAAGPLVFHLRHASLRHPIDLRGEAQAAGGLCAAGSLRQRRLHKTPIRELVGRQHQRCEFGPRVHMSLRQDFLRRRMDCDRKRRDLELQPHRNGIQAFKFGYTLRSGRSFVPLQAVPAP